VTLKSTIFRDVVLCKLVEVQERFREMSVDLYHTISQKRVPFKTQTDVNKMTTLSVLFNTSVTMVSREQNTRENMVKS
jgi:hypothetical protein